VRRVAGRAALALCLLALGSPIVAACGDDASDEQQIADAVRGLQRSFASDDLHAACEHLTRAAQRHVGQAGHGRPGRCFEDVGALADMMAESRREAAAAIGPRRVPKVTRIDVAGDHATARLTLGPRAVADVPLAHEDGRWKVDALYSDLPAAQQEDKFP
jgi:hypothetical protein